MEYGYLYLYARAQDNINLNFMSAKYHGASEGVVYSPANGRHFEEGEILRKDKLSTKMSRSMQMLDIQNEEVSSESVDQVDSTEDGPDKYVTDGNDQRSSMKRWKFASSKTFRHSMLRFLDVITLMFGGPDKYVTDDIDQRSSLKRSKFPSSKALRHNMLRLLVVITVFGACSGCTLPDMNASITSCVILNCSVGTLTWSYIPSDVENEIILSTSKRMIAKWNINGDLIQTINDERMRFNRSVSNGIESISLTIFNPIPFERSNVTYIITIVSSNGSQLRQASAVLSEKSTVPTTKVTDTTRTPTAYNTRIDIVPTVVLSVIVLLLGGVVGVSFLRCIRRRIRSVEDSTDETTPALVPPT
ncbi:uncharacterized protein LOC126832339 [Patella vulgata]|uniref:uncharacterized protein LOC126832339 n=1 Tax=Patella vulgata TaxID=6465 RepID=UPI0024A98F08|nr:uncharacterized protein LOC126832339 [Patella vulgata]